MIESRHTNDEKEACIYEYINGADKYYLAGKYSVSIRTIDRWIASEQFDNLTLRKIKRSKSIPVHIQDEILDILNTNPIFQGFNIAVWNEAMLMKYMINIHNIEINRRMAKALIEDARKIENVEYDDRVFNDIEKLSNLGYSIVLLDYIKIGIIDSLEIESLELREYTEKKLDVNLVIARADENIYLDIVVSELSIVDKTKILVTKIIEEKTTKKHEQQRKEIINDKYEFFDNIKKAEGNDKIVFITTYDKDVEKLKRKKSNIKYFIVHESIYQELLQSKYEGEYVKSIVNYMNDNANRSRRYRSVIDINNVVIGKIDRYVSKVTIDKIEIKEKVKRESEKESMIILKEEKMRKCFKIINSNFIYNI